MGRIPKAEQKYTEGVWATASIDEFRTHMVYRDQEIAKLKQDVATAKSGLKRMHERRAMQKTRLKLFRPVQQEQKAVYMELAKGQNGITYDWTPEEAEKVVELVRMLSEEDLIRQYPNWATRAIALQIPEKTLNLWRKTEFYKRLLAETCRVRGMEGTLKVVPTQERIGQDADNKNTVRAAEFLSKIGGLQDKTVNVQGQMSVSHTIEALLKNVSGVKTVDVESVEVPKLGEGG